jgi:hypothetical protein
MEAQSGSNFNGSSLSGNFFAGSWAPQSANSCVDINVVSITPGSGSSASGSSSDESDCSNGPNTPGGGSFTATVGSNGRAVVTVGGAGGAIIYIIKPSSGGTGGKFVALPNGDTNPKLESFQQ